jgi:hypothetical protein
MFWPEVVELIPAEMGSEMLAHNLRISINGAGVIPPADDLAEPALPVMIPTIVRHEIPYMAPHSDERAAAS